MRNEFSGIFPSRLFPCQKVTKGEKISFKALPLFLVMKWAKMESQNHRSLSLGGCCLQSMEKPMRFPRFSAVLAEFSTSTAENSKRLADFS